MSKRRVFVIAKTYPELSLKYVETVCTAAVDEAGGPVRLYPIPFRYLEGPLRFKRYQWITADLTKSQNDPRPESYSLRVDGLELGDEVNATPDEWGLRADLVLRDPSWHYTSMLKVQQAQESDGRSLAFMVPTKITRVSIQKRPVEDAKSFEEKFDRLKRDNEAARNQLDLFESTVPPAMRKLEFLGERICVDWLCSDDRCAGHSMQILDWEICELARKEGLAAAQQKVETLLDLSKYKSALLLGNFRMFPGSFAIIGLWYPRIANRLF
jgi:hypothetical protein